MGKYAAGTQVSSGQSRVEIERTLERYGATGFAYGWEGGRAMVGFQVDNRRVRFVLPMPDRDDEEFRLTPAKRYVRSPEDQQRAYEQVVRQRWRALSLCIKAKLEAVESGIVDFDSEFLAHLVLPNGRTVGEQWGEEYRQALEGGAPLPPLLPQ